MSHVNPSKAWALLNAHGVNWLAARGGVPTNTPADICLRLKGLARPQFLMGMLVECGDTRSLLDLERLLYLEAMQIAEEKNWPLMQGQAYCRRLSGLAIFETIFERPIPCQDCSGLGYTIAHGQGKECLTCSSTGQQKISHRRRAELASIPFKVWHEEFWSARYEYVFAVSKGWHGDARRWLERASDESVEEESAVES